MKKFLSVILCAIMLLPAIPITVGAETSYDNQYENFYYTKYDDCIEITGCEENATSVDIPAEIDGLPVTDIGWCAFESCYSLTNIAIPSSVTRIGDGAFYDTAYYNDGSNWQNGVLYIDNCLIVANDELPSDYAINNGTRVIADSAFNGCDSLTNITIPNSVISIGDYAFSGCGLTSITIPAGVTSIGESAFEWCDSLTNATIPSSVTSIGEGAFAYCDSLTSITVDNQNQYYCSIDGNLFDKSQKTLIQYAVGKQDSQYIIPDSVTSIGYGAFAGCDNLTSVTIPAGVTSIGDSAFYWCDSLTNVTIPNSVTSIGNRAFNGCSSLTSVTIPAGVISIGDEAFDDCSSLTSVTIPSSVTSIGNGVFEWCKSLTSITVDNQNQYYCSIDGNLFDKDKKTLIQYAIGKQDSQYTIPNGVISIGDSAFYLCDSLTSVTIPNSVTSIGVGAFSGTAYYKDKSNWQNGVLYIDNCLIKANRDELSSGYTIENGTRAIADSAFYYCDNLTSVTIPDSVTSIGDEAFKHCKSLKGVTIPDSVISIGDSAFYWCDSLTSVTIGNGVTSIGDEAFESCDSLTNVTIPSSVTSIGYEAFMYCDNLTSVTIPNSVTSIGNSVFEWCKSLTNITVDNQNQYYCSIDGNLLDKGKKTLIQYAIGKQDSQYTIPDSVANIGYGAFEGSDNLTSVTIPNSVTSIGESAFEWCDGLTNVTIPSSVISIGYSAFYSCYSLTDVYYAGSEEQWQNIIIEDYNNSLTRATIHYNSVIDTEPTKFAGIPTVSEENGVYTFAVSLRDIDKSYVMVAAVYNGKKLAGVKIINLSKGQTSAAAAVSAGQADTAKVFIWESIDSMKPLCNPQTVNIK